MLLMIDNYDSFTYNLVQYFEELGEAVRVVKNDMFDIEELAEMKPEALVISPGPSSPSEAGISVNAIKYFYNKIPILGVCLGHQSIACAFGGRVKVNYRMMHGKISPVYHDQDSIYSGVHNPFAATRYHSLVVEEESLPPCLQITARSDEGEIMGIRHRDWPVEGVQFHPESILTEAGKNLLGNFLKYKNPPSAVD